MDIFSFALNASEVKIVLRVKVKKTRYAAHGTRFFRKIIPPIPFDPGSFEGQATNGDLIATKIFAAGQTVYPVILYIISPALGSWQQSGRWIILDGSMVARLVPPISDSRIYFGIAAFVSPFRPQFLINSQFFFFFFTRHITNTVLIIGHWRVYISVYILLQFLGRSPIP